MQLTYKMISIWGAICPKMPDNCNLNTYFNTLKGSDSVTQRGRKEEINGSNFLMLFSFLKDQMEDVKNSSYLQAP